MSGSYGQFTSDLTFGESTEPGISQNLVVAAAGRQVGRDWSLRLAAGAILDGTMTESGEVHDIGTGWLATAAVSRRVRFGGRFFATGSFSIGFSSTSTTGMMTGDNVGLTATDMRLGALVGATFWDRFSPYLMSRLFGGPVFWNLGGEDITGSDQYHYQVGGGASVQLQSGFSALIDASLIGERSLSIGVTYAI